MSLALAALLSAASLVRAAPAGARPSVILVSVDDLRADRVRPELTPALCGLAAEGIAFTNAFSAATWTLPSHASMLTGRLPRRHLAGGATTSAPRGMASGERPLAAWFKAEGYRTAGFYNGPFLDQAFGFGRGFDEYHHERLVATFRDASAWVRAHKDGGPFFLFVHTFDVHRYQRLKGGGAAFDWRRDYPPPEEAPSASRCGASRGRYDDAVRAMDADLSSFFGALREAGLWDRVALAVTADHGEELCEPHGGKRVLGHAYLPYEEQIRVPWILKLPGGPAGRRDASLVSGADMAPTLAAAAGVSPPDETLDGVSRLPGSPAVSTGPLLVEGDGFAALRDGGRKLIVRRDGGAEYYDLEKDPAERAPSAAPPPAGWLRALKERLAAPLPSYTTKQSDVLTEDLKAEGYLR